MKAKNILIVGALMLAAVAASCATTGGPAGVPPEVKVSVINFAPSTEVGGVAEINFSVANLTDRELTGLTLTIRLNPSNGVDVPYEEMAIGRIAPRGSWNPGPFVVRGRHPGSTAVFFVVSRDGIELARDYALVGIAPGGSIWWPYD